MPTWSEVVRPRRLPWFALAAAALPAAPAWATDHLTPDSDIIVFGRGENRIGTARAASEGSLAGADLTRRPLLRTAELLESVPGMIVTQHSGSGKANQYFLRGFNLDHGTDFSFVLDGVPMNFRTHGHGQGYLDVNGLIPETVKRIDYRKGPYRADVGDFALVGMAEATTADVLKPFVTAEYGRFDWKRLAAGGTIGLGEGHVLLAAQGKTYDGPWALAERLRHLSAYAKYSLEMPWATLRATASVYDAKWRPTEQVPERAIGTLIPDAFGSLDTALRGRTERELFTLSLTAPQWKAMAWGQHYDWSMISNFTFFLDDPVNGDELEQAEKLWTWGGRIEGQIPLSASLELTLGGETRWDDIGKVGLYHTTAGRRDLTRSEFAVDELSGALYGEAHWRPVDRVTMLAGLRGDAYRFRTRALGGGAWSGLVKDSIVSPKLGVSAEVAKGVALYANWGRGFHSNDARGVTNPVDPAPGLVRGTGKEVGARFERSGLVLTANYWWMNVDSELIYVGDAGSVEPSNASRRHGYELTAFWRPRPWLAIDASYTGSHARFKDSPGANHVPLAIEGAGELGVAAVLDRWNASARLRYLGPRPLVEDDSVRGQATTIVNLRAGFTPGRWEFYAELLNLLNSKRKDIEYLYTSRLPGEPLGGVDDVHSRAVEPRMLRVGFKLQLLP